MQLYRCIIVIHYPLTSVAKYSCCQLFLLFTCNAFCQLSAGLENYHYFDKKTGYTWVPSVHVINDKNLYTSVRYNYEEAATFSAITGKSFNGGNTIKTVLTPAAGFAAGKYNGLILALNVDISYRNLQFSSQGQYSFGLGNVDINSFYSWTDLSCKLSSLFSAGVALQQRNYGHSPLTADPGVFAELNFGRWSLPFYYFEIAGGENMIVAGINMEWEIKKNNK
ncbi:MAG: hypothetical protein JST09_08315 [Bacteroidetes bacterium]|nr:hypothetical protein [Bacteroidota bacterium]